MSILDTKLDPRKRKITSCAGHIDYLFPTVTMISLTSKETRDINDDRNKGLLFSPYVLRCVPESAAVLPGPILPALTVCQARPVQTMPGSLPAESGFNMADHQMTLNKRYMMSVSAACIAESVTYPLDLTKTRLQLQGEIASGEKLTEYRGLLRTAIGIGKEEGFLMLWQGLRAALLRHVIYSGIRISTFEEVKHRMEKNCHHGLPLWKKVIAGMISGGLGQLIASPTDLVKIQIQMEGKRRLQGKKPRYLGTFDAFRTISRESGFLGLWRGCWPNVQRAALVNLDLATYGFIKKNILHLTRLKDDFVTHSIASGCSGLIVAIAITPADVIKARMMNQPTNKKGSGLYYSGSFDCLKKTVRFEGLSGMYKGFLPCWLRIGPWMFTFWTTFEQIRKICGAKSW